MVWGTGPITLEPCLARHAAACPKSTSVEEATLAQLGGHVEEPWVDLRRERSLAGSRLLQVQLPSDCNPLRASKPELPTEPFQIPNLQKPSEITKCLLFFFFFWLHLEACGILVPRPGIQPVLPAAVEVPSANHWMVREFPVCCYFKPLNFGSNLLCGEWTCNREYEW